MKKTWIYLLSIIILILAYGKYKEYKRFSFENYEYKMAKGIDLNYHDKSFLLDYYEAVDDLNSCVVTQWGANGIDVRNPDDDDDETKAAVKTYSKKLANVKFYEDQLLNSSKLKKAGMTNEDVKSMHENGISMDDKLRADHRTKMMAMFGNVSNTTKLGDKNAFVFEIQKLLKIKGYDVPVDGVFKEMTADAILAFETKNNFYPDGVLDVFTLEKLLE